MVALRARRHGPRAAHVGGPGAGPSFVEAKVDVDQLFVASSSHSEGIRGDELGIELRFYEVAAGRGRRSASTRGWTARATQAKRGDKAKQALAPARSSRRSTRRVRQARDVELARNGVVARVSRPRSVAIAATRQVGPGRGRRRRRGAPRGGRGAGLAAGRRGRVRPRGRRRGQRRRGRGLRAAGHGVIDVAAMLGLRVDAHPGRPRAARRPPRPACRGRSTTRWISCCLALGRRLIPSFLRLMVVLE